MDYKQSGHKGKILPRVLIVEVGPWGFRVPKEMTEMGADVASGQAGEASPTAS